jgi:putative ABC transport system substrate-binding protein
MARALKASGYHFSRKISGEKVRCSRQSTPALDKRHIPAIYPWRDFVLAGGLMSYGPHEAYADEALGQAANYVNRILNGEKPAEMPVQAPTKLALTINARTAKTLGLEIPGSLMALADEMVE